MFGDALPDYRAAVVKVPAAHAQAYVRRKLWKDFFPVVWINALAALIGGLLWAFAANGSFWFGFGVVLAVRVLVRLAFNASDFLEQWLTVPAFKGGRVEIHSDKIVRIDHEGQTLAWSPSAIRQIRLRLHRYWKGHRRIMTVRLPKRRNYDIVVPDAISFDEIERVVTPLGIPVSRPKAGGIARVN